MRALQLKANYKVIRNYYQEINNLAQLSLFSEGTVSPAFAGVLRYCAGQFNWTLAEQYTLKRSGITNDPNRLDDPQYIVRLIGQVITVSLETVAVVKGLPAL
jgi:predicted helicase